MTDEARKAAAVELAMKIFDRLPREKQIKMIDRAREMLDKRSQPAIR